MIGLLGQSASCWVSASRSEETGFAAGNVRPLGVIDPLPAATAARTHLFLAIDLRSGTVYRDDTEIGLTVHWWKLRKALDAVRSGRITEAGLVAGLLLAERRAAEPRARLRARTGA